MTIKATNPKTGVTVYYPSIDKIDDNYGFKKQAVNKILAGKQKTHKGFEFELSDLVTDVRLSDVQIIGGNVEGTVSPRHGIGQVVGPPQPTSAEQNAEDYFSGRAATFERTQPQRLYTEHGGFGFHRESASFISPTEFEMNHANILSLQVRGALPNLFSYPNGVTTFNTRQLELLLRSFAGGGVAVGLNDFGELVVLGTVSGMASNPYSEFIGTSWDFALSGDSVQGRYQITQRNVNRVISGELDVSKGFVVFTNKNTYLDWWNTDFQIIEHFCGLLAIIKTSERSNLIQARTPYLVKTSKDGLQSSIIKDKMLAGDLFFDVESMDFQSQLTTIPLQVPDRTGQYQSAYQDTMNQMLTLIGVYNATESGMERLTAGQVSANSHITELMGDIYLSAREKGVELCNLAFGTELSVIYNQRVAQTFQGYFANPNQSFINMEQSRMTQLSGFNTQNSNAGQGQR